MPLKFSSVVRTYILVSVVMGPEQTKALHARYSKRAQPFGLTLEELDFKHFPVHNVQPNRPAPGRPA